MDNKLINEFRGPKRRARKDTQKARTSHPSQLVTRGSIGRREGRRKSYGYPYKWALSWRG